MRRATGGSTPYASAVSITTFVGCPPLPDSVLDPRSTWPDAGQYDAQAAKLAKMFTDNFKTFEADVTPEVKAAGPKA